MPLFLRPADFKQFPAGLTCGGNYRITPGVPDDMVDNLFPAHRIVIPEGSGRVRIPESLLRGKLWGIGWSLKAGEGRGRAGVYRGQPVIQAYHIVLVRFTLPLCIEIPLHSYNDSPFTVRKLLDNREISSANFADEQTFVISFMAYVSRVLSAKKDTIENLDTEAFQNLLSWKKEERISMAVLPVQIISTEHGQVHAGGIWAG